MEGENEPKPKKTFGSSKYFKKKERETQALKEKENQDSNIQPKLKYEKLPEDLAGMMDKIVSQMDIICRTVCLLEKRVTDSEELVQDVYESYRHYRGQKE